MAEQRGVSVVCKVGHGAELLALRTKSTVEASYTASWRPTYQAKHSIE